MFHFVHSIVLRWSSEFCWRAAYKVTMEPNIMVFPFHGIIQYIQKKIVHSPRPPLQSSKSNKIRNKLLRQSWLWKWHDLLSIYILEKAIKSFDMGEGVFPISDKFNMFLFANKILKPLMLKLVPQMTFEPARFLEIPSEVLLEIRNIKSEWFIGSVDQMKRYYSIDVGDVE